MSVDFQVGSPFATALQSVVQPKLAEYGWTTDEEDSTVFEYILLMLGNNKNEGQIAMELATDLLDLPPDNAETQQFAHWLFGKIHELTGGSSEVTQSNDAQMDTTNEGQSTPQDTEMDGTTDSAQGNIPTGPKAMRNGSGASTQPARGGRMLNQLNRQMGRTQDDPLRRVRGSQGAGGRINSHSRGGEPPKGPRSDNIGRGLAAMANGRGTGNVGMGMGPGGMNGMNGMNMGPMGAMPGMSMPPMGQGGMPGMLNPQQQMALMQMYEQQAQMMQQIFSGQTPTPYVNPSFQQRKNGRPLSERVNRSGHGNNKSLPQSNKFTKKEGQDETMGDSTASGENGDGMDTEGGRPQPFDALCKFNLRCSRPDCAFAHQSPAAPEGTPVDMKDTCTFGAKCTNKKCVGRHPSPAQRHQFQTEQECAFYPNCRDQLNCPYKHPTMPPCRNGADCTTPGCKFWHNTIMCKFNPCTNNYCPYKHVEGQKKTFKDKVWVANKNGGDEEKKEHVSERKFINDDAEEELIIPGQSSQEETQIMTE